MPCTSSSSSSNKVTAILEYSSRCEWQNNINQLAWYSPPLRRVNVIRHIYTRLHLYSSTLFICGVVQQSSSTAVTASTYHSFFFSSSFLLLFFRFLNKMYICTTTHMQGGTDCNLLFYFFFFFLFFRFFSRCFFSSVKYHIISYKQYHFFVYTGMYDVQYIYVYYVCMCKVKDTHT